jgi:hypothetical protein
MPGCNTAHATPLFAQAARAPTRHDKLNPPTTPCEPRAPAVSAAVWAGRVRKDGGQIGMDLNH